MPTKARIVFDSGDSSSEDDAELDEAMRLLANGGVARRAQQAGSAHGGIRGAGQEENDTLSLFGISEGEFEAANSLRESDDSLAAPAEAPATASLAGNTLFPPGLLDSDSDENLLICLPIRPGAVEEVRGVSTETVGAASQASPQSPGFSSDDSSSDDDSSDDGFYGRDKKMLAKRSLVAVGNYGKDAESSDDDYSSDDGFNEVADKKMPAKRNLVAVGNGERSKKSAKDTQSADDESSFLSSSEEEDETIRLSAAKRTASKPREPNASKGSPNSSGSSGSDSRPSSEDEVEEVLKQAVASRSSNEGTVSRDYDPEIGDRVYACFDENDERGWYWGNTSGYQDGFYSIRFEDGDYAERVSRKNPNHILTIWEYMRIYETHPAPVMENDEIVATLNPRQMYASRCKWCELCIKPDCGSCATCKKNSRASSNHGREVCLQKMCLEIPLSQKKQPAIGLPPNWTFAFSRNTPYISKSGQAHIPGLFIYHPEHETKTFRSIEAAVVYVPKLKTYNQNVVTDFYNHIGIVARGKAKGGTRKKKRAEPRIINSPVVPQKAKAVSVGTVLSPQDLYANRCKKCELCMKQDCGACWSCISNKKNPTRSRRPVCFQKMCLAIPDQQKKQPAKGLPEGFTFIFTRDKPSHHGRFFVPGLFISHSSYSSKAFRSVEAAVDFFPSLRTFNPNVIAVFNRHIGVQTVGNVIPPKRKRPPIASPVPRSVSAEESTSTQAGEASMTLEELYEARCGTCENCCKDDCGQCSSCVSTGSSTRRQVCVQKMCCEIPAEQKAQPMPRAANFPVGWRYIIDPSRKNGLAILPPRGQEYHSAERAKSHRNLHEASVDAFYDHIGASRSTSLARAHLPAASTAMSEARSSAANNTFSSRICGVCDNCTKPSCGKCARCIKSPGSASHQCFQKMCFELPVDEKAERAIGLPNGWRFYFAEHIKPNGAYRIKPVPHLFILSEGGKKFRSVEAAVTYIKGDESEAVRKFYTHVGLLDRLKKDSVPVAVVGRPNKRSRADNSAIITDYSLNGRGACFAWTDVSGQTKLVYGTVTRCEVDEDGRVPVDKFKVIFCSQSRSDANSTRSEGMPVVPESRILPLPIILGGCISLEQQIAGASESLLMDRVKNEHQFVNWVLPNWRKEDQVVVANAVRLPRLTLIVRGYRLELHVKQSSIPNAGYGVFLKCKSLTKRRDGFPIGAFELKAGELIDLGVYGPFRPSDVKRKAVFIVKDFIFSHKCEEWVFNGDLDNQIDITDDVTADLHDEAKAHVLAYVNESNVDGSVCIRAEHDPEGSAHYLLGHAHQSEGIFSVPVDDDNEMEIFIHYLEVYEKVRIRKSYSFLPDGEEKNRLLEEIASEDVDDILVMNDYDASDIKACVEFLTNLVSKEGFYSGNTCNTVKRTLIVAAILQRRASRNEGDHGVNMKKVFERSKQLVSSLLTRIRDEDGELKRLQADGNVEKVLVFALRTYFSTQDFSKLSEILI